jgi:serpin B
MKIRCLQAAFALLPALAGPLHADSQQEPARGAAQAGEAFGVDLYRLFAAKEGNVFFSPYSVSEALALLSAGADGKTRQELLGTLHWRLPPDQMAAAFAAQDLQLDHAALAGAVLTVANGLWFQEGDSPQPAFLNVARGEYRAEVHAVDFIMNPSAVVPEINEWVEKKTNGKISNLFPEGSLGRSTRLVLANAIYFKGKWDHPFKKERTSPRTFHVASDQQVMAEMMAEKIDLRTVSGDDYDLLELPYEGGDLSMVILLPKTRDGLAAIEQRLGAANLAGWLASLESVDSSEVEVEMPRFKATYSADLTGPLESLGVSAAFSRGAADFTGIDGKRDLFISAAVHKAYVDVNEEGTEAAGATGMVMSAKAMPVFGPIRFIVDHPFLFLIRNNSTGGLLFFGRIVDPTKN